MERSEQVDAELRALNQEIQGHIREHKVEKREAAKTVLGQMIEGAPEAGTPKTTAEVMTKYSEDLSNEVKLRAETLVDDVFHKGLRSAVKAAKNENAAVLDAFKDSLVKTLEERGFL